MKKLIIVLSLVASANIHAQDEEKHYTPETEKTCSQQVAKLGCGTPTEKNADTFIACVDQKVDLLTETCRDFHQTVKNFRQHKH